MTYLAMASASKVLPPAPPLASTMTRCTCSSCAQQRSATADSPALDGATLASTPNRSHAHFAASHTDEELPARALNANTARVLDGRRRRRSPRSAMCSEVSLVGAEEEEDSSVEAVRVGIGCKD